MAILSINCEVESETKYGIDPFKDHQLSQSYFSPFSWIEDRVISQRYGIVSDSSNGTEKASFEFNYSQGRRFLPSKQLIPESIKNKYPETYYNPETNAINSTFRTCSDINLMLKNVAIESSRNNSCEGEKCPLLKNRQTARLWANVICSWTITEDRDNKTEYLGYNYQGRTLVNAKYDDRSQKWIFWETLYNEDGLAVEEHRPMTALRRWKREDGGIVNTYFSDINTSDSDFSWRQKNNLIKKVGIPLGGKEKIFSPNTGRKMLAAHITDFEYEPYYNQLKNVLYSIELVDGSTENYYHIY
jgi:hypothetical protein